LKRFIVILIGISLLLIAFSCRTVNQGSIKKNAQKHNGKARIVDISPAKGDNGKVIGLYMNIIFDFIPSETGAVKGYKFPESVDSGILLFYDNRNSFHINWIKKWGIKKGNEYPAARYEADDRSNGPNVYYEVDLSPVH